MDPVVYQPAGPSRGKHRFSLIDSPLTQTLQGKAKQEVKIQKHEETGPMSESQQKQ